MSFYLLLVRTQELNFIALLVTEVRAGLFLGKSLCVNELHPGLSEILLPFKKGRKKPKCTSRFEQFLLPRCCCFLAVRAIALALCTEHQRCSLWDAPSLLLWAWGSPSHPAITFPWQFTCRMLALLG